MLSSRARIRAELAFSCRKVSRLDGGHASGSGVKINLLIRELMLLGPELEEFFAVHDSSSRRTSSGTRRRQRKERYPHVEHAASSQAFRSLCRIDPVFVGSVSQSVWVDNK
jgi:hypothetical protein